MGSTSRTRGGPVADGTDAMSGGWQCLKCGAAPSGPGQFCAGCGADLRASAIAVPSAMPMPAQQQAPRSSASSGVAATLGCVGIIGCVALFGLVATGLIGWFYVRNEVVSFGDMPSPIAEARFRLDDIEVTDACSGAFDYCVRATCLVHNVGTAEGTAVVLFDLDPHSTQPAQATETVIVPVATSRAVMHDFPQAGAFSDHNVECHIR